MAWKLRIACFVCGPLTPSIGPAYFPEPVERDLKAGDLEAHGGSRLLAGDPGNDEADRGGEGDTTHGSSEYAPDARSPSPGM